MIVDTISHTIRRGDTLSSIARHYATSIDEIVSLNRLTNKNQLTIGQELQIPRLRTKNGAGAKQNDTSRENVPTKEKKDAILDNAFLLSITHLFHGILDSLLVRFREQEAKERVQKSEKIPLTHQPQPATAPTQPPQKKGSKGSQHVNTVKEKLKEQLGKDPHIVTFAGVKLTQNEKKQIMASVATCEMNSDGFGSINADTEFVGRKFKKKGIEISSSSKYSRIVHIGLSYGLIQYTQDSGNLGIVLSEMRKKNQSKFKEIFGGGDESISDNLISLTTFGRSDLRNDEKIPLSGLAYWNKIKNTKEGKETYQLANQDLNNDGKSDLPVEREIRGKRVQPIPPSVGEGAIDLWTGIWKQRFLEAGKFTDFQEVQIEIAVRNYMQPILAKAKLNNVRTAIGLAFIVACSVRGGPASKITNLLFKVASELGLDLPFKTGEDEIKCIKKIASADNGVIGKVNFDKDECRRAKELLRDELGFLAEDLYDISTYC